MYLARDSNESYLIPLFDRYRRSEWRLIELEHPLYAARYIVYYNIFIAIANSKNM